MSSVELTTRLAPVASVDTKSRTVEVVFSVGAAVKRRDFYTGQPFIEELEVSPAAVNLARMNAGAPVLAVHEQRDLASVLGVVEKASIANGEARAVLRFSERPDVEPIFHDIASGILRGVSVGYTTDEVKIITPAAGDSLEVRRVTRWTPFEISIVPIAADAGASVRAAGQPSTKGITMPELHNTAAEPVETREQAIDALLAAPSVRALGQDFADALRFNRSLTVEQVRGRILDRLASVSDRTASRSAASMWPEDGQIGDLSIERRCAVMAEAVAASYGGPEASPMARAYRGQRVLDMARELLELRGIRTGNLSRNELFERALGTSDLPNLLTSAGDRLLREAYQAYDGGIRQIAKKTTARDFRAKTSLQLSEAPALEKVNENGEFHYGAMSESRETYQLATYGRIVPISRQAIVNDDLGAFTDMMPRLGRAAVEFEAGKLVDLLTMNSGAGPTMDDGVALFNTAHGNLAGSGATISVATLGAARQALRTQKGLDGKTPIDTRPKFLLVPAALETVAEQFLTQLAANAATSANPFAGQLVLVVDPRLDVVSETAWYVASDPAILPTIEYAYLEDEQGPKIVAQEGWKVDGIEFKVRLDYGAGVVDHRGLYRNPGPDPI